MALRRFEEPFTHWTEEAVADPALLRRCVADLPPVRSPRWCQYGNDCERHKRTCNDLTALGSSWLELFRVFQSMASWFEIATGTSGLESDPSLHGAGCHVTSAGGWLNPHLDYERHPYADPPLDRAVNVIVFLNETWREEWGGAFTLCDQLGNAVKKIYPQFGRAVIWCPGDLEYHGTEKTSADAPDRVTAAYYYLRPASGPAKRKRALFMPTR